MWSRSTPAAAVLALSMAACAGDANVPRGTAAHECTPQIRFAGVVYTAYDYTERAATRLGRADQADCHDVGRQAPGSVFPDDPRDVAVRTFDGFPSEQVLGVRFGRDSFAVFVADSVPRHRAERISRALRAG